MYGMSRLSENEAAFLTSAMIYQDIANVPTPRRSSQKRGKINHQPAFTQGKKLQQHPRDIPENPSPHYYYDIYQSTPHKLQYLGVTGECFNHKKQHITPSDSHTDLTRVFQDVTMQKRSTSAYVTNQDLYRNPDAFLSSLPMERRYLRSAQTTQSIPWNTSNQALRLSKEWTEKLESRANKRTSQVMGHRIDKLYMMNGNAVKLQPRYDVTDEEIRHLKQLAKTREEKRAETRQSKHLQSNSKSLQTRKKAVPKKLLPPIKQKNAIDNDDVDSSIGVAVSVVKLSDSEGSVKSERKISESTSTASKNEADRLGGGVQVDGQKSTLPQTNLEKKDGAALMVKGESVDISDPLQQNPVTSVDVSSNKDNNGVDANDKQEVEVTDDHSGDEAGAALKFYTEITTDDDYDDDMESLEDFEVFHNVSTIPEEKK